MSNRTDKITPISRQSHSRDPIVRRNKGSLDSPTGEIDTQSTYSKNQGKDPSNRDHSPVTMILRTEPAENR